jgi:hypothetical protein
VRSCISPRMHSEITTATQSTKQIAGTDWAAHLCSAKTIVERGLKFDGCLMTTINTEYFFSIIDPNFLAPIIAPSL